MPDSVIYTIGHSTHSIEAFGRLLAQFDIQCVVDVRSTPYSRRVPHFNKEPLAAWLRRRGIRYAHMPEEFGARFHDPDLLDADKRVDFDRVRAGEPFRQGMERLREGMAQGYRIVLMCAEADPFDCHRFSMISYQLAREGFEVKHILRNGTFIGNETLETRLLAYAGPALAQTDLLGADGQEQATHCNSEQPVLEQAYRARGREIAYQGSHRS